MEKQYSLEKTLGLEIEINNKHFDLIITNEDIAKLIQKALTAKIGLYATKEIQNAITQNKFPEETYPNGLYYRSEKIMVVITLEDIVQGMCRFALKFVSFWDKANETHQPKEKTDNTICGMITISNLKEKGIENITKEIVNCAWKREQI